MEAPLPSQERLRWQCRRGMLELDVLLEEFLRLVYPGATEQQQHDFVRLLEQPDPLLLEWFMGKSSPGDPALEKLVGIIRRRT